ncbi:MAG: hypothetical protein ACFB10_26395 [Salibacteraceae bacterium]
MSNNSIIDLTHFFGYKWEVGTQLAVTAGQNNHFAATVEQLEAGSVKISSGKEQTVFFDLIITATGNPEDHNFNIQINWDPNTASPFQLGQGLYSDKPIKGIIKTVISTPIGTALDFSGEYTLAVVNLDILEKGVLRIQSPFPTVNNTYMNFSTIGEHGESEDLFFSFIPA